MTHLPREQQSQSFASSLSIYLIFSLKSSLSKQNAADFIKMQLNSLLILFRPLIDSIVIVNGQFNRVDFFDVLKPAGGGVEEVKRDTQSR